jgi:hypothetical protein
MRAKKKMPPAGAIKSKLYADGGKAEYPKPRYMDAVKDRLKSMLGVGDDSTGLAKRAADKLADRRRQIDEITDSAVSGKTTASNYRAGGAAKKKRMGFGGMMIAKPMRGAIAQIAANAPARAAPAERIATPRMPMRSMARAKGGMTRMTKC